MKITFRICHYETKQHDQSAWKEISEIDLIQKLHETFGDVSPLILQLIEGKRVLTPEAVYRIKDEESAKIF